MSEKESKLTVDLIVSDRVTALDGYMWINDHLVSDLIAFKKFLTKYSVAVDLTNIKFTYALEVAFDGIAQKLAKGLGQPFFDLGYVCYSIQGESILFVADLAPSAQHNLFSRLSTVVH